jgi:outer membrane protein assembly factor BamD (BamD/ComL family)
VSHTMHDRTPAPESTTHRSRISGGGSPPTAMLMLLALAGLTAAGCASLQQPRWPWSKPAPAGTDTAESTVLSSEYVGAEPTGLDAFSSDNLKKRWKKSVGRGPNEPIARQALAEGDALFRDGKYREAIPKYKQAIDRWPDSGVEEDALWQLGECLFFTDQYPKAEDTYDQLVKKYANTRYLDRIAQRQFVIAHYWVALDERQWWPVIVPNVTDRSRPIFDTRGRAMKAYEHVRLNDPRGPLADDSIIAQANSHFLRQQWFDADYFYGLLRTEYPDSEFLLQAHLLGLQAKLRAYEGPSYEGSMLDQASLLADQILVQFPDQLGPEDAALVQRTRGEIGEQLAQRNFGRAEWYAKGKHYSSARIYYALVARDYPETQLAVAAREKFEAIRDLEDVSDDPLPILTALLNPDKLKDAELDAMAAEAESRTAVAELPPAGPGPLY